MAISSQPNIVVLISDNQRLDTLGILGHTPCRTPTWDRIGREGAIFENLRSTSPLCSPARASIFTGFQPHQAGMPHLPYGHSDTKTDELAMMEITKTPSSKYLRDKGYQCLYAGKWHLGERNISKWFDWTAATDQDNRDYSEYCKEQGIPNGRVFHDPQRDKPFRSKHYPRMSVPHTAVLDIPEDKEFNRWVLDNALTGLAAREPDKPFFMVVGTEGPHPPLMVPEKYYNMYDPDSVPEPPNWNPSPAEPSFLSSSYYRKLRHEWGDDFAAWRKSVATYWGYVTYIDSLFGEFIAKLEEEGVLDNTIVMMISDHGEMMGQHGLWQKFCPYEEAIRVPWVIRWPGRIKAGTRCKMDVSHVDVGATLLAAAGIETEPLGLEGENLLPYITGQREEPDQRDCFTQYNLGPDFESWHGVQNWRAIVRRPWKYVLHQNGEAELYNIVQDPYEMDNEAGLPDTQELEDSLREALLQWSRKTGDPFAEKVSVR